MRFYKVDVRGKIWVERRAVPTFDPLTDQGRVFYATGSHRIYYGNTNIGDFLPLFDGTFNMNPQVDASYNIGSATFRWNVVRAVDFYGNVRYA